MGSNLDCKDFKWIFILYIYQVFNFYYFFQEFDDALWLEAWKYELNWLGQNYYYYNTF
jgi:hypothetical protein